jgi:hypothetical protein
MPSCSPNHLARLVDAGHVRLEYARMHCQIVVDQERWLIGFVQGAPCKVTAYEQLHIFSGG